MAMMKSSAKIFASSLFLLLPFLLFTGRDREQAPDAPAVIRAAPDSMRALPHTVIVKLREGVAFRSSGALTAVPGVDACLQALGPCRIEPLHRQSGLSKRLSAAEQNVARLLIITYEADRDPRAVAADIARDASVAYAQPSYIYPFHHTPNDPLLAQQSVINLFKLTQAWDITTGDSTVAIGDVDSGCDWTHPDLNPNIYINKGEWGVAGELSNNGIDDDHDGEIDDWHGWDFVGSGTDTNPIPDNNPMDGTLGHGTMTAGCASAATNNGMGVAGVGYRTKILPVKAASNTGTGISYGYQGIMYAADMGCRVINTSWGGSGPFDQAMQDAIDYAFAKGALIVASSGNMAVDNDDNPFYPSSLNHVLNVGATETNGQAANWAVYGTSVGVYALGSNILTTAVGGGYTTPSQIQGTSFSSPYTAGVAALLFGMHPNWNPDQVAAQIRVSSDAINTPRAPKMYGRVNAFRAVSTNQTLTDIPGVRLVSFAASIPGSTMFTRGGQTAQVTMILENELAPTSAAATATVEFDDANLSSSTTDIPLGALNTFGRKTVTFPVTLTQNPSISEGWLPVRLKITDGTYLDYVVGRVAVYLNDNWHLSAVFGVPSITSIGALDGNVVWAVAHVSNPLQDYCIRTSNGGTNWVNATPSTYFGGTGLYCVAPVSATTALAGSGPTNGAAEVWRTTNAGFSWSRTSVSAITGFVDAIHMFDAQNGILIGDPVGGKWGIAKTADGGVSWSAVTPQLSAPGTEAGWNNSADFVGDVGWFGTNNNKLYKTTDRGATWTACPLPGKHSVNVSFSDANVGLAKFSAVTNQGGSEGLAVTTDGGTTWTPVTSLAIVSGAEAIMERNGSRMWVVQGGNSYMSADLGQTWSLNAVPSSFSNVACLERYRGNNFTDLYAGGLYIFKMHIDTQSLSADPIGSPRLAALGQNYPNPAGGNGAAATTIPFTIGAQSRVRIALADQLGREVMTLVDAELAPGSHSVSFGTTGLPTGAYHVVMRAGGDVFQRSMIILR